MTKRQKFRNIMIALLYVLLAVLMITDPEAGYLLVMAVLSIALLLYGIKQLVFFFTMARHMVGGKRVLYRGMIFFDLGAFTVALADIPKLYIMIYLMGGIIFTGAIEVLRAFEKKKASAGFRMKLLQGIICISIGILGLVFSWSTNYMVYFYCAGMIYSAFIRVIEAFRKDIQVVTVAP